MRRVVPGAELLAFQRSLTSISLLVWTVWPAHVETNWKENAAVNRSGKHVQVPHPSLCGRARDSAGGDDLSLIVSFHPTVIWSVWFCTFIIYIVCFVFVFFFLRIFNFFFHLLMFVKLNVLVLVLVLGFKSMHACIDNTT